jgi:ribose transport system substrate-binding protein
VANTKLVALAAAMSLAALAAGCGDDNSTSSSSGAQSAGTKSSASKPIAVSFVVAGASDPFFITQRCGAEAAALKYNVKLSFQGPTAPDFQQELKSFNTELVKQPDAMVVVPFNPTAFLAPVRNAVAKGIPVVLNNGTLSQDKVGTRQYVTDEVQLGSLAAEGLAKQIGQKGEVAVLAFRADVPPIQKRIKGFREGLKAYPNIKLVSLQYSNDEAAKAASQVGAMLQGHPQLKGIFATDTTNTQAAASALKGNGKSGAVKLVGYDASPLAVKALKDGTVQALVSQNPYQYGYETLKYAAQAARKQVQPSDGTFTQMIGGKFITKENVDSPEAQPFVYRASC